MERFSVDNRFRPVSFEQYLDVAERLEASIKEVNPNVTGVVCSTTDGLDYHTVGSLTIVTPLTEEARDRREQHELGELDNDLWSRSFKTGLYLHDETISDPYMIALSIGDREPKSMKFYGQCLDDKSQAVFDGFRRANILQKIGDGSHKTSPFALAHAMSSLNFGN